MGVKVLVPTYRKNQEGNLSALFFGWALDQMDQKCPHIAKNVSFGPNLAVFGPKIHFLGGMEQKFWYPPGWHKVRELTNRFHR